MDYQALLYDPIYNALGVAAVLSLGTDEVDLTVIDKTSGIEAPMSGDVSINTIRPACAIRVSELSAKNVPLSSLKGNTITFEGNAWRIEGRLPKPGPQGEMGGEVYLTLIYNG